MSSQADVQAVILRQKRVGDIQDEAQVRDCWSKTRASLHLSVNGSPWRVSEGIEAVMETTLYAWSSGRHGGKHLHLHFLGPMAIEIPEEGPATALYVGLFISTDPEAFKILGYGEYDDEFWFEDGQWRIGARRLRQTVVNAWPGAPPR